MTFYPFNLVGNAALSNPVTVAQGGTGLTTSPLTIALGGTGGITAEAGSTSLGDTNLLTAPTGALAETFPRNTANVASTALTSGQVGVRAIGLRAGTVVTNLTLYTTAAGTLVTTVDLTHGWYALLDSTLHVLAVSADQIAVAFMNVASTQYPLAMGSPYTVTTTGLYYVAFSVSVSAASMPQVGACSGPQIPGQPPILQGTAGTQAAPPSLAAQLNSGTISAVNTSPFYAYVS